MLPTLALINGLNPYKKTGVIRPNFGNGLDAEITSQLGEIQTSI